MGSITRKWLAQQLSVENVLNTPTHVLVERIWHALPALMTEKGIAKIQTLRKRVKHFKASAKRNAELATKANKYKQERDRISSMWTESQADAQRWMAKYAELKDKI